MTNIVQRTTTEASRDRKTLARLCHRLLCSRSRHRRRRRRRRRHLLSTTSSAAAAAAAAVLSETLHRTVNVAFLFNVET